MKLFYWFAAIMFVIFPLLQPICAAEQRKEVKQVLVLYSEDKDHPAHQLTDRGIQEVFRANKLFDVRLFSENLDWSRFSHNPSYQHTISDYLHHKYSGMKIDVIIAVYPDGATLLRAEKTLFPKVPIIASQMTNRGYIEGLKRSRPGRLVTGTTMEFNFKGAIASVLRVVPNTKRIALIAGTAPADAIGTAGFRENLRHYAGKIEVMDLTKLSMEETLSRVSSLPPDTSVIYSTVFRDGAGKSFVPREALSMIVRASNMPVFGIFDSYLGFGIVGGQLVSFEMHGREAAAMALRIMGGESSPSIPVSGERSNIIAYDWRELKRWNIPQTALPAGAEIRYYNPSPWERYRGIILGVASLIIGETFLVIGLLFNYRRRRRAGQSLSESEERVKLAVSSAGTGLWSVDQATGHIWATDRTRELFGFTQEEPLTYEKVITHIHPSDHYLVKLSSQRALEWGEETSLHCRIVLAKDVIRWIMLRFRLQEDLHKKRKYLMGACADITERMFTEEKLRQREVELSMLTERLINTHEEELKRLSLDLHDDLTQRLAVLAIDAGMLEKVLRPLQPDAAKEVADLKTKLIEVSDEVHNLSRQLHPSILDDLGLIEAIRSECEAFSKRTRISIFFESGDRSVPIPSNVALCLYRILQECLQNISKHSKASEARVVLKNLSDGVRLSIQDFGIGFNVEQVGGKGQIGLPGMRERARLVNGMLSVISEPGKGTEVQIIVPIGGTHANTAHIDS